MATRIKRFRDITNEAISGTEVPTMRNGSYFGPSYGDTRNPNTVDPSLNTVVYSELDGRAYTQDDFNDLYDEYLKSPGEKKIKKEFTQECIDLLISQKG